MEANELRRTFTDFFVARDHTLVPSASLIPHDPSLLFTNSGMVPFKPYFLGEEAPPYPRAVSVQKVVRAGGKHNDLDEVGRTSRHLTFFEMLGNFSFGDYFKEEAIAYAWELVTDVLGFDPERLWVTVHLTDDDAADIWRDGVGVPADRIQRLDDDNWWRMADTGPNGPSSEVFFDRGPEFGDGGGPAHGGEERFLEFWNLVFMQFDQQADGTQVPLPKPSIDTGAGLERVLSVLDGHDSVWATDEFQALLRSAGSLTRVRDGDDARSDVSLRILADHARSSTMLISDGVFPSNEERGYVLRRILRRAIRHAYLLGVEHPVMPGLVDTVVDLLGEPYPELVDNREVIHEVVEREEIGFRRTLASGSKLLDAELEDIESGGALPGAVAFQLHDTYGFPLEVTQEITAERGVPVDLEGFEAAMGEQRSRAQADQAAKAATGPVDTAALREIHQASGDTEFVGRERNSAPAVVLHSDGSSVVLDQTPFYAESGGQVGDTGEIIGPNGRVRVDDTTFGVAGIHLHHVAAVDGRLDVGDAVTATIDDDRRQAIRRNHTATHILHWALREVLGDHVKQQGSWVGPDRLRFDFSHFEAVRPDQIAAIEDLANAEVLTNAACIHIETSMEEAQQRGALAFFGDKYGDRVRVLEAGAHSVELCGGTHVRSLGDIGNIKIIGESSIGSNLRRIEAVTGTGAVERLRGVEAILDGVADRLGVPAGEVLDGSDKRMAEIKELRKRVAELERAVALGQADDLAVGAIDGLVVGRVDGLDQAGLRELAVAVRDRPGVNAVVLGGAPDGGGAALAAAVSEESGLDAGALLAEGKTLIQGGGRPAADIATAGGKNPDGVDGALAAARAAAG
ncbi:MAG: alanine--tRNA ligase [Acidimicrobiia bacterium]|nr:alanine--tRNA ligase [Acidimicrobiia bacterium]